MTDDAGHDDHTADALTGDAEQDWFIFNLVSNGGAPDTVTDLATLEATHAADMEFINGP